MDFMYEENIERVELIPSNVNLHSGWAISLGDEEDPEDCNQLLFESTEDLDAFVKRLAALLTREEIWSE